MTSVPLRIGPLGNSSSAVVRSGVRWLCDDGHWCRPGEAIAFCNVGVSLPNAAKGEHYPFYDERRDFQVVFAPRMGGRLKKADHCSDGGFYDRFFWAYPWQPDFTIGTLEEPSAPSPSDGHDASELRLLLLAGRRMTSLAEVYTGLLAGWYNRSRGWWSDSDNNDPIGTVLGLGLCDLPPVLRGSRHTFFEMFAAVPGPAQVVVSYNETMMPAAIVLNEQLSRTPEHKQAITADLMQAMAATTPPPAPEEWMFAGTLLSALHQNPLIERPPLVTRTGVHKTAAIDAVILSVNAEPLQLLRHRRLGYTVNLYPFRWWEVGPALRRWFQANFEHVPQSLDDLRGRYRILIDTIRAQSNTQVLIMNALSTSGNESIHNYAAYDRPMAKTLFTIRHKEMNLMLHDLARERDISIVDVDAIAADLGSGLHFLDAIHQSGLMQTETRGEIIRILAARGIPGFGRHRLPSPTGGDPGTGPASDRPPPPGTPSQAPIAL